jgi:FkbM family methyltransferase
MLRSLKAGVRRALPHPAYRTYRKLRVARQIRGYEPRTHQGSYGGHALAVRFEDPLAESWYGHDWPELPEIAALRSHGLVEGARVFDLGAHQAVVALMLAREVGRSGTVIAVEAEPHNHGVAEANKALNGADNLHVVHAAVGDRDGTVSFAESLNGQIDTTTAIGNATVPSITIDTLAERYGQPDVVFVDIEGYEALALAASPKTLASRTAWFVEVHVGKLVAGSTREVIDRFAGRELLIAPESASEAGHRFVPFTGDVPGDRFFLLAV